MLNRTGFVLACNRKAVLLLHARTANDLVGRQLRFLIAPEDQDDFTEHRRLVLDQGAELAGCFTFVSKSGERIELNFHSTRLVGPDGQFCCLSWVLPARPYREQEERVRKSEKFFRDLFKYSPQLMSLTTEAEGRYLEVNDAFLRGTGYSRSELIGRTSGELNIWAAPEDRQRLLQLIREEGGVLNEEFRYNGKDGRIIYGLTSMVRVNPGIGDCLLTLVVDVTKERLALEALQAGQVELRRAKEEAEAANQAKRTFVAHMSHELRTPISGLLGLLDMLDETGPSPEQSEHLSTLRATAKSMLDILNDTLDLARIEAGRHELKLAPFDPVHMAETAVRLYANQASAKGLRLMLNVRSDCPRSAVGDERRLSQILRNLLGNALKFTEHGEIRVELFFDQTGPDQGELTCKVSDTGIGIPQSHISGLFEPFSQIDPAGGAGTGLGLAISKGLIEAMGGRVEVASSQCKGTSFTVVVPLRLGAGDTPDMTTREAGRRMVIVSGSERPMRLLLAEDNIISARFLSHFLVKAGHEVVVAGNGAEALAKAKSDRFDAIVMDIQMPVMSGEESARRIIEYREEQGVSHEPIIALTAMAMRGDRERFLAAGFDAYVAKPVELEALELLLRELAQGSVTAGCDSPASVAEDDRKDARSGLGVLFRRDCKTAVELVDIYLKQTPVWIAESRKALAEARYDALADIMHSVANGAGVIKADDVLKAARELENRIRQGCVDDSAAVLDEVIAGLERSATECATVLVGLS